METIDNRIADLRSRKESLQREIDETDVRIDELLLLKQALEGEPTPEPPEPTTEGETSLPMAFHWNPEKS